MKRIGIPGHGFVDWGGGVDFLRLTASSLRQADADVELHVLAPTRGPLVMARALRDRAYTLLLRGSGTGSQPAMAHLENAFSGCAAQLHIIDMGQRALAQATRRLNLDVLIPSIHPVTQSIAPWVGYLFDFQHKHLPHFFTAHERARRDLAFFRMLESADAVVVNAQDVLRDIEHFYPRRRAKVFAMPFSPAPSADAFSVNPEEARLRHGVSGPYFIICNQFWKHKDHATAFKAFAIVAQRHPDLTLVCTGATSDYRFPGHFEALMNTARRDGVADRIHVLGLIPKLDQLALLRGSIALIQPTLFEGGPGGGAVYDAVALGHPSIASDIPVNREISEPTVSFFETGQPDALAEAMVSALNGLGQQPESQPDLQMKLGFERRRACGQLLMTAIAHVAQAGSADRALPRR